MPVKVAVDLSGAFRGVTLRKAEVEAIAQNAIVAITQQVYNQIRIEASKGLKKTRNLYIRNINTPVYGRMKGSITLTGSLPNMLEQGASAFDIKVGFKKSSKKKTTKKGGWYLTIPFRHATTGSIGESEAFSSVMDRPIMEMARALKASRTAPFVGSVMKGGQISASQLQGTKFGILGRRELITERGENLSAAQKAAYTHKAPKYAGLGRSKKFYELVGQGSYQTFRRVSSKSAPNSWIHKGFKARNYMIKAMDTNMMEKTATRSIGASLDALGF